MGLIPFLIFIVLLIYLIFNSLKEKDKENFEKRDN
jgi:hypothetical protein